MDCNQSGSGFDKCFVAFLFQPAGSDGETMLNTLGALLLTLLAILYSTFGGIAWINWQEAQV